jgi:dienelactone hydrolase
MANLPSEPASRASPGPPRPLRWLGVALALIALGDLGACLVQTDGGKVEVVGLKLPTEDGQWLTADLFRPRDASPAHRVPLVVVCPGFERSKESMDSYSIELARRDIAVLTIDPYNQGASSSTRQRRSVAIEGNGVIPVLEYVFGTPNLDYIDRSRIGAAGYSAGGNAVLQTAARLGQRKRGLGMLRGVFVGGYIQSLTDDVLASVHTNVAIDYARFDEGAYRNANGDAELSRAPEALRLVNAGLPSAERITQVEIGRAYGDPQQGTLRLIYNTRNIHPLLPYDPRSVAHLIDFFTMAFGEQPVLAASDQRWIWKELFTLAALAGSLLALVPIAALLLQAPCFRSLAHPLPPALPAPSRAARVWFWASFAGFAAFACLVFVPLIHATSVLFPAASASQQTWWFPQRMNNAVLLWAVANGALGLLAFWLNYALVGKKRGVTPAMWGTQTNRGELLQTLGLAISVLAAFYALLFVSYGLGHVDFRFVFISAAASFPPRMVLVALEYVPLFFIFYFANSVRVNFASRFAGQNERLGMLLMGVGNSIGLLAILLIQYGHRLVTNSVFWTREWIYMDLLFGVIPMMFVLPYFHRAFFRLTGRVYLGPMVTCPVFIMMMLTSNVCYIPLG